MLFIQLYESFPFLLIYNSNHIVDGTNVVADGTNEHIPQNPIWLYEHYPF